MSESKRKNFSGDFKAKVALEALRGIKTVNEIGQEFGVHPTQVGLWKKELQEQASSLFDARRGPKPAGGAYPYCRYRVLDNFLYGLSGGKEDSSIHFGCNTARRRIYPCGDGRRDDGHRITWTVSDACSSVVSKFLLDKVG